MSVTWAALEETFEPFAMVVMKPRSSRFSAQRADQSSTGSREPKRQLSSYPV